VSIMGVIYPYAGPTVYLSIGRTDGVANATGTFGDTYIRIVNMSVADAANCVISFDIDKY